MMIKQPWTEEQVKALNTYQTSGRFHPFTCPGDFDGCEDHRELTARTHGWECACGKYTQDWAHDFMME